MRSTLLRTGWLLALASLTLASCSRDDAPTAAPSERSVKRPAGTSDHALDGDRRRRADQLISVFENSSTEIQYDYAENIHDGRGVTSGRAGFTTATCDALSVIEVYTKRVGKNPLAPFVPELERLCSQGSAETSRLPEQAYVDAWKAASREEPFRAAQDAILDREYFLPAMRRADSLGLTSALGRAQLYDAAVQHGDGDDPDGLPAMITRTNMHVGTPRAAGEKRWLYAFFDTRVATLANPANKATAAEWRDSVDRVRCMRTLADAGNYDLDPPIVCDVYGDRFTID